MEKLSLGTLLWYLPENDPILRALVLGSLNADPARRLPLRQWLRRAPDHFCGETPASLIGALSPCRAMILCRAERYVHQ